MSTLAQQISQMSPLKVALAAQQLAPKMALVNAEPIAIIGMGCRFPGGANTPDQYWQLLQEGRDAVVEMPTDRWDVEAHYDPDPDAAGKMTTRHGGFLQQVDAFDASFFGISPREAAVLDPQQRLLLEVSWEALEHANIVPGSLHKSATGVYVGITTSEYEKLCLQSDLASSFGNNHVVYMGTGNDTCAAAGRLSYSLGLTGPSMSINTACSSSLVATHLACESLRQRSSHLALAGGVNLTLIPDIYTVFSKAGMLSADGRCKTFDASADGYVRGEGCGILVLKRLSDAVADGDHVLALIRGSAVNQDGRSSGLTVPNGPSQQAVIRQALDNSGVIPSQVGYVEAHGTGTSLGDPIEVGAMGAVFSEGRQQPLLIGSAKTNIGHLESGAGAAGLIKTVLSLQHGEIPPNLHFKTPNPHIAWDQLPIKVVTERTPWPMDRRIAGVSSFGYSGTNAHFILEAAPTLDQTAEANPVVDRPTHVLTLSARTEEALAALASRYVSHLQHNTETPLADICFMANSRRTLFSHRLAVVASSKDELGEQLSAFASGAQSHVVAASSLIAEQPNIAFLFTGQGSQYTGMGRELYDSQPTFRRALEQCDEGLQAHLEYSLLDVLYPDRPSSSAPPELINETAYTQPALFALEYSLATLWQSWGVQPDIMLGHSVGEYVAACVAGIFSLEDGLRLIAERGRLMQALPHNGTMMAIRADESRVAEAVAPYAKTVSLAAINGPQSVVISGETEAVQAIGKQLEAEGIGTRTLTVSHAFHSPLMEPMLAAFEAVANSINYAKPNIALVSNLTGRLVTDEMSKPSYWVQHIREAVHFDSGMSVLKAQACSVFLEIGSQPTLLGMGQQCIQIDEALWAPSLRPNKADFQQLLASLAELSVRGVDIDWKGFDQDYQRHVTTLPTYPFQRQRHWLPETAQAQNRSSSALRPLIDTMVQSPLLKETILETSFSTAALPFLADHQVFEEVVVPGASHLCVVLSGADLMGLQVCQLEDVIFPAPLILPEAQARTVQAVLSPDHSAQNDTAVAMSFQLISTTEVTPDAESITHATGRLLDQLSDPPSTLSLPDIQQRCQQVLTPESLYDTAAEQFIEFGPSFRWISGLWRGEGEALAQFSLPESIGTLEGYCLHPGLLDACFQTAGVTLDEAASSDTLLPFTVQTLQVLSSPVGQTWWCHGVQVGPTAWDIQLFDPSGQVLVNISGFEMRKAPRDAMMKRQMADWLYEVEWQAKPLAEQPLNDDAGRWLIFGDADGLGGRLVAQLHAQGQSCLLVKAGNEYVAPTASEISTEVQQSVINPAQAADFHRLVDEAFTQTETVCRGVVYLWSTEPQPASEAMPKTAEILSVGALNVVQALRTAAIATPLWLVTQGALAISAEPDLQIAQASMWGLGRTLAIEQPELSCVCLDLSPEAGVDAVATLLAELAGQDGEDQVAWRAGTRQVARLIRYKDHNSPALNQPNGPFRVQLADYGSADELRLTPVERREPAANEVEIEVKATALNFRDVLNSLGMLKDYYAEVLGIKRAEDVPLGFECSGTIVAVGSEVNHVQVGDDVVAATEGSFARFVTVDVALVARKPENMSFEAAAGTPTAFLTAYYGLNQLAKLQPGERVLIHSAAGGVGQAAVQLAQAVGAEIFATASPGKWQVLKSQGVSQVMNSRTLDFADEILRLTNGEGVQVVLNSLNGEFIDKSFEVLAQGGRFVEIGKIGIWEPQQVAEHRPDAQYYPFDLGEVTADDSPLMQSMLTELMDRFKDQQLTALPQTIFPIGEVANAYRYMQQTRHIGKVVLTFTPENNSAIREDSSYLITGGLGGLGLKVAEYLADQGARHLILASRSGAVSEAAQSLVQTLTDQGISISVVKADVAQAEDVARLLDMAQSTVPLRGIIHAAGVIDDGAVLQQTPERFARVMAPKVQGAWHLHTQTLDIPLDHFICFSSIASLMGSPGQTHYAAANAVVDLLMHQRRAQGLPGMSINWGPWAETGMAAELSFESEGLGKIVPDRGIQVLADLMQQADYRSPAQIGVFPLNWSVFMQQFAADQIPPLVSQMQRRKPSALTSAPVVDGIIEQLQTATVDKRAVLVEAYILNNLAQVTGQSDPLALSATQPWDELGLDSLMTVELKNSLDRGLGITVPIDIMMQVGTPHNLTAVVLDKVNAAIAKDPEVSQAAEQESQDTIDALEAKYDALARQIPQLFTQVDEQKNRQVLIDGRWRADLASLNYLGMDLHPQVIAAVPKALKDWGVHPSWSRGIASPGLYEALETGLAELVGAPSVLVFPSISLLHLGILPLLAGHDGVILKDVAAHRSIYEACLRAQADGTEWVECRHNDLEDLEKKLASYALERTKIVAVDGVYSMTGDFAPLPALSELAKKYNATIYVDDAHGLGLIGENPCSETPYGYGGGGMVKHFGLNYEADRIVYIAGLSKSFSSYGAFITCNDQATKEQFEVAPPFIFSGPSPIASLASAVAGLKVNREEGEWRRKHIYTLTRKFVIAARDMGFEVDNENYFPVIGVVVGPLEAMVEACQLLWEHDILITPAIFPSVSLNRSLMRFSITADNTEEEVDQVIRALQVIWDKVSITPPDKHDIVHLPSW